MLYLSGVYAPPREVLRMIMWCALTQILPVLEVTPTERVIHVVQAFMETDEYKAYVEDVEVCMGIVRYIYDDVQLKHFEQSGGNDFCTVHVAIVECAGSVGC